MDFCFFKYVVFLSLSMYNLNNKTINNIIMIDIYNEFGYKYNPQPETVKNLLDVYLKLYFKKVYNYD